MEQSYDGASGEVSVGAVSVTVTVGSPAVEVSLWRAGTTAGGQQQGQGGYRGCEVSSSHEMVLL